MVPNLFPVEKQKAWNDLLNHDLLNHPVGGAGRVRWWYPKPEHKAYLLKKLREIFRDSALVVERHELSKMGLMTISPGIEQRVGDIVLIATQHEFLVPDSQFSFEHGSIMRDEMLVPIGVLTTT